MSNVAAASDRISPPMRFNSAVTYGRTVWTVLLRRCYVPLCTTGPPSRSKGGPTVVQILCISRQPSRSGLSMMLAIASCALVIPGCGSSTKPHATATGTNAQGIRYADCMRAHGVSGFPDPNPNGGVQLPSDVNPVAPAFQSAQQKCASLQPNTNGPRQGLTPAQQAAMVRNAQCMRRHGLPDLPDPTFGPGGVGVIFNIPPAESAAAIQLANRACAHIGTPLPLPNGHDVAP